MNCATAFCYNWLYFELRAAKNICLEAFSDPRDEWFDVKLNEMKEKDGLF